MVLCVVWYYAICGTDFAYGATLRVQYAMSSTEFAYSATSLRRLPAYVRATHCAVLSERMVIGERVWGGSRGQCDGQVPRYPSRLRTFYAMSGTDVQHGASAYYIPYAMSGTDVPYGVSAYAHPRRCPQAMCAIVLRAMRRVVLTYRMGRSLRACDATPGTDLLYGATRIARSRGRTFKTPGTHALGRAQY
eukprot:1488547-Rhodomonas_salina.2